MKKTYISPEAEIQKFTIYCDEQVSVIEPGNGEDGGNEFDF